MNLRLTTLSLISFIAINCCAQKRHTLISGKIMGLNKPLSNINIINLSTRLGSVSNHLGEFKIQVSENDTLLFSSIQYQRLKIIVTKNHLNLKKIEVRLNPSVTILEEVFLQNLIGSLNIDMNNTPNDTIPKHNFIFKLSDLSKKLPEDTHGLLSAPNAQNMTDPIKMSGGGSTIPDFYMIKIRKLKQQLLKKKLFPIKIKKELGSSFFTNDLRIPEEKIDNFLAYCEYRDIIEKYYKNKLLEVIEILQQESKIYNAIKN